MSDQQPMADESLLQVKYLLLNYANKSEGVEWENE